MLGPCAGRRPRGPDAAFHPAIRGSVPLRGGAAPRRVDGRRAACAGSVPGMAPRSSAGRWTAALVAALVSWPLTAVRADDVAPPPTDCPPGAAGSSRGRIPHCEPLLCDGTCPPGLFCIEQGYCIATLRCGHRRGVPVPEEGRDCTIEDVRGVCDAAGACDEGTCTRRRVCLAAPLPPAPSVGQPVPATSTGLCTAGRGVNRSGLLLAGALLALAARRFRGRSGRAVAR
jgi:hypothetical protein